MLAESSLDDLLGELYGTVLDPDRLDGFLGALSRASGSHLASMTRQDFRDPGQSRAYSNGASAEELARYAANAGDNIWVNRSRQHLRTGAVFNSDDWVGLAELRRSRYYNEFLRAFDTVHSVALCGETGSEGATLVTLCRSGQAGPYDEGALALLGRLGPHWANACALRQHLREASIHDATPASRATAVFLLDRGFRLRELKPEFPGVAEPRTGKSMGAHCEDMAREWNIPREAQDELAVASHHRLAAAYERGFFDDLVVPFRGVSRDNVLRADTSVEKLATLKPAFDRASGRGTLTAGNSTPLTDGAAACLLSSDEWAAAHGHEVLCHIRDAHVSAVDFVHGEGLLMAPTVAVAEMLARNGLALQDFDLYEIHEAFAAQVLCTLKAWESPAYCQDRLGLDAPLGSIDRSRMNVHGGSVAIGHPFAATGARIVATLAHVLEKAGSGRGLISICTAGGMGVAAILERDTGSRPTPKRKVVHASFKPGRVKDYEPKIRRIVDGLIDKFADRGTRKAPAKSPAARRLGPRSTTVAPTRIKP